MYCSHCGKPIPEGADYCLNCGCAVNGSAPSKDDSSSFGFALLGFLFPLIGLILYFVYEDKRPKRAKSVGKGALVGVITGIVVSILLAVATFFFSASIFDAAISGETSDIPVFGSIINEIVEELDDDGSDKCEVTVGQFSRVQRTQVDTTMLDLTVTNTSDETYSFDITIEAYDADGMRLGIDSVYVTSLAPGRSAKAAAFEFVPESQIADFTSARFEITAIRAFDEG